MASTERGRPDGRQARWDRHNQERRQQIIDAALAVIEAGEPGAEVHVQQYAEQAGLSRTVIYRHFADRADLDRAVQTAIVEGLAAELLPAVTLDGTIPEIVGRVVRTYVDWATTHPALHHVAEQDTSLDGSGPLQQGIERIAAQVVEVITTAVDLLDLEVSEDERAALDPLVFGLVGAVFGAVRRWMAKPEQTPPAPLLVALTTDSVWFILQGHARSLGLELRSDQPIEQLLEQASAAVDAAARVETSDLVDLPPARVEGPR
ncbi:MULTISPECIES: TetR/AcrR family transcriptional regulator [Nocardioides]|uniref:TetR/AcrR family transcriptional regulator n=1 Tax=Nocardioides kribbensis TaxID=305517 RepID=A0ABV1NXX3_9ACTN|nr:MULTISPECIES: TetR/AcrR family transcriptional regulator [Nocardioides]MBJ7530948.1 TetR/AcrR family transcriptional regulator [Nocardioides sp.]